MNTVGVHWHKRPAAVFPGSVFSDSHVQLPDAIVLACSADGSTIKIGVLARPFDGRARSIGNCQNQTDCGFAVLAHAHGAVFIAVDANIIGVRDRRLATYREDLIGLTILGIMGLSMRDGVYGARLFTTLPMTKLVYLASRSLGGSFHDLNAECGMDQVVFMETRANRGSGILVGRKNKDAQGALYLLSMDQVADGNLMHWTRVELRHLSAITQLQRFANDSNLFAWTEHDGLVVLDVSEIVTTIPNSSVQIGVDSLIRARNPNPCAGLSLHGMSRETDFGKQDHAHDGPDQRFALVESLEGCQRAGFEHPGVYQVPLSMLSTLFGEPGEYVGGGVAQSPTDLVGGSRDDSNKGSNAILEGVRRRDDQVELPLGV